MWSVIFLLVGDVNQFFFFLVDTLQMLQELDSKRYVFIPCPLINPRLKKTLDLRYDQSELIFNHNANLSDDFMRSQYNMKPNETKSWTRFVAETESILLEAGILQPVIHSLTDWVVMYSKPGTQRQHYHYDYDPDDHYDNIHDAPMGLIMCVSEEPAKLHIWKDNQKHLLEIRTGQMLVFRHDLCHAGAAYDKFHVRLHCYIDSKHCERLPNGTYFATVP